MPNPYTRLGNRAGLITAFAMIGSLIMFGWLTYHGAPLKPGTSAPFCGILALELSFSKDRTNSVLMNWKKPLPGDPTTTLTTLAIHDIYWDFLFIAFYASAIALLCGRAATRHTGGWAAILLILAWAQPLAAVLDIIENWGMLIMLRDGSVDSSQWPFITTISAATKFVLIGTGLLAAFISLICSRWNKHSRLPIDKRSR
ncbi:MAG: hypothetical protein RIK87_26325 [Fuerstiella sp.]